MALSNLWRNKILSVATIFVMASIIFIFNIILSINVITSNAVTNLTQKIDIVLYIKDSTPANKTAQIINTVKQFDGVKEVTLTTKEQALADLKSRHPEMTVAFEKYELGNPLPASINIKTLSPDFHKSISEKLKTPELTPYLSEIISDNTPASTDQIISSVTKNLYKVSDFAKQIILWLIITFLAGGTLVIINALHITIFSRRKEISIMKLVGASPWLIRLPFIAESMIYALLAIALSSTMFYLLINSVGQSGLETYIGNQNLMKIFFTEVLIALILSGLSAIIAVQKYIHLEKSDS